LKKRILDIGCGARKVPGAIGLDKVSLPGVDIIWDLEKLPYPIKDSAFDEVHMYHVLEHLSDTISIMEEVWRIAKAGAKVFIRVPHYSGRKAWIDLTHKKAFSAFSFDYFGENQAFWYYSKARFKILKRRLKLFMSYPNPRWYVQRVRPVDLPYILRPICRVIQLFIDISAPAYTERMAYLLGGIDEVEIEMETIK